MRFTLKYAGTDLLCSGNTKRRKKEKQLLRTHFSRQLTMLWRDTGQLREVNRSALPEPVRKHDRYDLPRPLAPIAFGRPPILGFLFGVTLHGARFVPTITGPMHAHCSLALRIGRPARAGSTIFEGGDLDGRLKTLFDALTVPRDHDQVDAEDVHETEYVCLLSDDALITGVSIESYRLLEDADENFVDLDVAVTITAVTPMNGTIVLLFG